jgi:hypothetical protein
MYIYQNYWIIQQEVNAPLLGTDAAHLQPIGFGAIERLSPFGLHPGTAPSRTQFSALN